MKNILIAALLLFPASVFSFECPKSGSQEKADDCPWAGAARLMSGKDACELGAVFSTYTPGLLRQLEADRANPALLKLWGESINYDELANGEIVDPAVLSFISGRLGAPGPSGKIMHAGAEHTYALLAKGGASCSAAVKKYAFSAIKRLRLTEEVQLAGGRRVALRTDFVPFAGTAGGNTHLLVYSVYDSAAGQAYLISAFPVAQSFVDNATAPGGLGKDKPVQTRYNAYVEGFTGAGKFRGT